MSPAAPAGLLPPPNTDTDEPRPEQGNGTPTIRTVHVDPTVDRRKREVGEEGEEWALAAIVGDLIALDDEHRYTAIEELRNFLDSRFNGEPIRAALPHAERALSLPADEELVDELLQFVHVSRHSDAFGFDVLGWLRPSENHEPHAMCIEVKNSSDGSFHLSTGEWNRAEWFNSIGEGDRYAVLVVRRGTSGSTPQAMDLLVDPVALVGARVLAQTADGYKVSYRAGGESSASAPPQNT
jgi:hypothetical protein